MGYKRLLLDPLDSTFGIASRNTLPYSLPTGLMSARIAIIAASDSFAEVWPQLASFAGARIETASSVGEIRSLQGTCGVLVAAGGVEDAANRLLQELKAARAPDTVVAGADTNYRTVAGLLQGGASNYFALPCDLGLCRTWFADRVERFVNRQNAETFAADERQRFDFSKLIGKSPKLQAALKRTSRVIPRGTAAVLITGETGTGKELIARAIHYNSSRAAFPFVEINCTTLPEHLLEAELFGYEPGAFTDARTSKPGLFEIADGGTLFLDEIGDLSGPLQGKLLRVLEEKRVRRLGSVRDVEIDLRVVAATHVDLPEAIRSGRFRQDLFYRLSVVPIRLPALRERGDDVILLAEHFLERFAGEYEIRTPPLSPDIRRALKSHPWPGNVRELRNAIERAVLLGDGHLFVDDLFPDEMASAPPAGPIPFPASMQVMQRAAAIAMVEHCGGNKSEAAKALRISRKHLYSLLSMKEGQSG
jgi:DNA-binding NtrC family response regulator